MPDGGLLGEETQPPIEGESENHEPLHESENPRQFGCGFKRAELPIARAPQVADETNSAEEPERDSDRENIGPVGLKLGREGIEPGAPAKGVLVKDDQKVEHAQAADSKEERLSVEKRLCALGARGDAGNGHVDFSRLLRCCYRGSAAPLLSVPFDFDLAICSASKKPVQAAKAQIPALGRDASGAIRARSRSRLGLRGSCF